MNMNNSYSSTMYVHGRKIFFAIFALKNHGKKGKIVNTTRKTYIWAEILS